MPMADKTDVGARLRVCINASAGWERSFGRLADLLGGGKRTG